MAPIVHATLTDFLRDPNAVVDQLERHDVVLRRRNAGDLRLTLQSRSEEGDEALRFVARFLAATFADEGIRDRLVGAAMAVPWVSVLPPGDRRKFTDDLIRTAEAAGELGSMAPLAGLVAEWKAIAAGYADATARPASMPVGSRPATPVA